MPLPDPGQTISDIAVVGTALPEGLFPRSKVRRISADQGADDLTPFEKRAAAHLDYSIDLHGKLESAEIVIGCYAWTSAPTELIVGSVRYAMKGVLAFVYGGIDGQVYELVITVKTSIGRVFQFIAEIEVARDANEAAEGYVPPTLLSEDDPAIGYLLDVLGEPIAPPLNSVTGGWL